jgi:hypothetical protein
MGKLLSEIKNTKPKTGGTKSKIPALLAELDSQDAQDLLVALADETIQSQVISDVLQQRGVNIGRGSIQRFRAQNL